MRIGVIGHIFLNDEDDVHSAQPCQCGTLGKRENVDNIGTCSLPLSSHVGTYWHFI